MLRTPPFGNSPHGGRHLRLVHINICGTGNTDQDLIGVVMYIMEMSWSWSRSRVALSYYAPAQGTLSDDAVWRLSVAYIGPKSRTERPRKTKIGTEVAHVTCDLGTTFKVTRPLWLVVLAGQHGHTVMVIYPYTYMTYIVSPIAGLGGGVSWRPPAYSLLILLSSMSCN